MHRREFIRSTAAAAFIMSLGQKLTLANTPGQIPYRVLGHTGEKVSLLGIGGYHIGQPFVSESTALQIVRTALDSGVNFLDNCWDYHNGRSEERMGKALRDGYRDKAFLMTKVDGRTAKSASEQLNQSLQRLQTGHLDLIQMHQLRQMDEPDQVFAPGGAMEALLQAKKTGKVRYIGFTGHTNPKIHLHMLELADQHGFVFDSVQMPLNVMDAHFNSFGRGVLPVLAKKNIGILGMKTMGDKSILKSKTVTPVECLKFSMNLPLSVCITGCDSMGILQQVLDVVRDFKPLTHEEVTAILAKTEAAAINGEYEPYKASAYIRGAEQDLQSC
jgi:predicted aldo/keto reductase-like oxidoreductase